MLFSEDYMRKVEIRFEQRRVNFRDIPFPDSADLAPLEADVREALIFLYAWMPLSDAAQVPVETFLDFAKVGAQLRREKEAVRKLPDSLFGEYVLYHRVNTEEIRPCRSLFRKLIGDRTEHISQLKAALAVNDWCAENGTYHSDDDRTISALAFYERGYGRCGEESVFCVNAMRSVGIPARQVYAPFWPHTDDNHAWVEFYAEGRWHFLGACEPMPAADAGWFNRAASRAMLVHSRRYSGPEYLPAEDPAAETEVDRVDIARTFNQLPRYSSETRTVHIRILDRQARPKAGVPVQMELLNMAHWCTIATPVTGADGDLYFVTGRGSLRARIRGSEHAFADLGPGDSTAVLTDDRDDIEEAEEPAAVTEKEAAVRPASGAGKGNVSISECEDRETAGRGNAPEDTDVKDCPDGVWRNIDFLAPAGQPQMVPRFSACEREENSRKLKRQETIRRKRTDGWENPAVRAFLEGQTAGKQPGASKVPDSSFSPSDDRELRRKLVRLLSEKDRTDCPEGVLEDHLREAERWQQGIPEDIFEKGILAPRIDDEILRPWRAALSSAIPDQDKEEFRKDPGKIVRLAAQRVKSFPEQERDGVITSPAACWTSRTGSSLSRKILIVAIARVCGIPAWLRMEDKAVIIWKDGRTQPLLEKDRQTAALQLHLNGSGNLQYGVTWSLSEWSDETRDWKLLNLRGIPQTEDLSVPVVPGRYLLVTANRLPNGSLYASELSFRIREGEREQYDLALRRIPPEKMLMEADIPVLPSGRSFPAAGDWRLWFWVDPGEEPTEHILNELLENRKEYSAMQDKLVFLDGSASGREDPLMARVLAAFPEAVYIPHADLQEREDTARSMYLDPGSLPIIVLVRNGKITVGKGEYAEKTEISRQHENLAGGVSAEGNPDVRNVPAAHKLYGIFGTCGYNVGTGRMLLSVIRTMKQMETGRR